MLSQKQMRAWIPGAIARFKAAMPTIAVPSVPFPEIYIASDKKAYEIRTTLVEQLQSPQKYSEYESVMETIHGELGDAIIIYQKETGRSAFRPINSEGSFCHCLCHELGHFYALHAECPSENLIRFVDQTYHRDERFSQFGYIFWSEFIAEVIACHCDPDVENIDWESFDWHGPRNELAGMLSAAFCYDHINGYSLAHYFATLLANKNTVAFLDAAEDGRLKVRRGYRDELMTFEEAKIDPTCLMDITEEYHEILTDLKDMLAEQLSKERYWETNLDFVTEIGYKLQDLDDMMENKSTHTKFRSLLTGMNGIKRMMG